MLPLDGSKAYVSKGLAERIEFKCVCLCVCVLTKNKYPHKGMRTRNSILASPVLQRANLGLEFKIMVKMLVAFG